MSLRQNSDISETSVKTCCYNCLYKYVLPPPTCPDKYNTNIKTKYFSPHVLQDHWNVGQSVATISQDQKVDKGPSCREKTPV